MASKVVIAGGGVAALEAALALRALADDLVDVELVAQEAYFWYRPLSVAEPFGRGEAKRFGLPDLAAAAGASFSLGRVVAVDADRHVARTSAGAELPYDALLLATGAVPHPAIDGALTFRGPADTERLQEVLDAAERGDVRRLVFAVPWGSVWSVPIYELALMTSEHLAASGVDAELSVVTPEEEPLQIFGPVASEAVRALLVDRHVGLHTVAYPVAARAGELRVVPHGSVRADRVIALPRLRGEEVAGVPQTAEGFVPVDAHGRVVATEDVYAAGDVTAFPVKQGGIATQQADAAAETIAASLGVAMEPTPFRPVLRGVLLTGGRPRYLRSELGRTGEPWMVSEEPLWWPPAKIVGRYFAPFFAELASLPVPSRPESAVAVEVEVDLTERRVDPFAVGPLEALLDTARREEDDARTTVGDLVARDVVVVEPADTLGEAAEKLCAHGRGSALVSDYGRLVGILTSGDLARAYAERVHPSEGRVRDWMTAEPMTLTPDTSPEAAALLTADRGFHHLPVVEGERPVGMLGVRSLARHAVLSRLGTPIGLGF